MKAIIWGSCGSLPSPASSADIRSKVKKVIAAAKDQALGSEREIDDFLDTLPHSMTGTFRANTSCIQIDAGTKDIILCDAGTGLRDYALSLNGDSSPKTFHIFISHLHWDHIQGFPFFAPAYAPGNRIIIHAFHKETETVLRAQMDAPTFPVPFTSMLADIEFDIQEEGAGFQIENVVIKTIKQQHPGASWGYRFEKAGKSIVYSTDSEHGPESQEPDYPFVDFFGGTDILIYDGQYSFEEAMTAKKNWGHSDHNTGVALAARAKVKKLVLCHHEPSYSDEEIEQLRIQAEDDRITYANSHVQSGNGTLYPVEILTAYDGQVLEA